MLDPHDLNALRLQLVEKNAIHKRLQEEREAKKVNALIERKSLMRKIKELRERNKVLASTPKILQYDAFGDLEALRTEREHLLQDHEFDEEGPVIRQVQKYAPFQETVKDKRSLGLWLLMTKVSRRWWGLKQTNQ